ncbi:MAG: hypothetical protein ACYCW6_19730, partial [Candidatus Xenobia bacterium]
ADLAALQGDYDALNGDYARVQTELEGSVRGDDEKQSLREENQRLKLDYKKVQSRLAEAESGGDKTEKGRLLSELQQLQQVVLELRRENETLVSEKNAPLPPAPKAVETTLETDTVRTARLLELTQKYDELNRTMREKDRLLDDAYKEKILLREELEKEQREKYERVQMYERERRELTERLNELQRQQEKDRLERQELVAELTRYTGKKKFGLFG